MKLSKIFNKEDYINLEENVLIEIEQKFNIKLPHVFKVTILEYNGCSTDKVLKNGGCLTELLNFNEFESNISFLHLEDRNIDNINYLFIPFATTPGGDYYCFVYDKQGNYQSISYFDHEEAYYTIEEDTPELLGVEYLINTFEELLDLFEYDTTAIYEYFCYMKSQTDDIVEALNVLGKDNNYIGICLRNFDCFILKADKEVKYYQRFSDASKKEIPKDYFFEKLSHLEDAKIYFIVEEVNN